MRLNAFWLGNRSTIRIDPDLWLLYESMLEYSSPKFNDQGKRIREVFDAKAMFLQKYNDVVERVPKLSERYSSASRFAASVIVTEIEEYYQLMSQSSAWQRSQLGHK